MLGTMILLIVSQFSPEIETLKKEVVETQRVLAEKEIKLNKLIASIPETLGPIERINLPGYGDSNAQRILSGPKDVGLYRVVSVNGDPYGFLGWLNTTRAQYGLSAISYDPALSNDAMINNTYGFGHTYMGAARRQNAAYGMNDIITLGNAWMNSAGHRSALLDPTITMMGIAFNGSVWTWGAR